MGHYNAADNNEISTDNCSSDWLIGAYCVVIEQVGSIDSVKLNLKKQDTNKIIIISSSCCW